MEDTSIRTGIFVQVRLNSTRLSRKALLLLKGGNIIQHVMRSLLRVESDVKALLTDDYSYPILKNYATDEGFDVFIGSSDDVLKRYTDAAYFYDVSRIIRATGDNPLVSGLYAGKILKIHHRRKADMSHYLGIPWGSGVEVIEREALSKAEKESTDPTEREHITTYMYRNRQKFHVVEERCPRSVYYPDLRVTVDTSADFEFIAQVYEEYYSDKPIEIEELIFWLKKEKREFFYSHSAGQEKG